MAFSITYPLVWQLKRVVSSIYAPTDPHKKWGSTSICGLRTWKSGGSSDPLDPVAQRPLSSHEKGPRKRGLKIVRSVIFRPGYRARWASIHCGRKSHTHVLQILRFATWNVRTLLDKEDSDRPARRTALVAAELSRYDVDIPALSEIRFAVEGSLTEVGGGYTIFSKSLPHDISRMHGVSFAIRTSLIS